MTESRVMPFLQLARPAQLGELMPLSAVALFLVILMVTRCAPALRRRDGRACSLCLTLALTPLFLAGLLCGMTPRIAIFNAATATLVLALGTFVLGRNRRRSTADFAEQLHARRRTDPPARGSESHTPETATRRS